MYNQDAMDGRAPVRSFDARLVQRVAAGYGGVWEARQIEGLMALAERYERALKRIVVCGDATSAMLAARVMAGDAGALAEPCE